MHNGYLVASIVLLLAAVGCIGDTVYRVIVGKYGMGSGEFWGSVACHAVMAVIGAALMVKAAPRREVAEEHGEEEEKEKEKEKTEQEQEHEQEQGEEEAES